MVPYSIILGISIRIYSIHIDLYVRSTEWHERRRGALYCIIFFIFHPTYKVLCIVSKQNRREIAHFEHTRQKRAVKAESKVEENAMEWLLKEMKGKE